MGEITEIRGQLKAAVEPLLEGGEELTVAAAPSTYQGNLKQLGFYVVVQATPERLDDLLEPSGGVRAALEGSELRPQVKKSSGHQVLAGGAVGVTWTVETLR